MSTTVPPPGSPTPCEELPRVFVSGRLNVTFTGQPAGCASPTPSEAPSPPRKTHSLVRPFENVVTRPPRIQLLGLLPAILKPCGPACAQPFTNRNVEALRDEEWRESPPPVLSNTGPEPPLPADMFPPFV